MRLKWDQGYRWVGLWGFLGVVVLLLSAGDVLAARKGNNFVALDFGAYVTNIKERVTSPKIYQSSLSHIVGFVRVRRGFHLGRHFFLEPALGIPLPWQTGADGTAKTLTSHWDLNFVIPVFSFLRFRMGPGLEWLWTVASSEVVTLNNGTSTADFYVPGGSGSSLLLIATGGMEILISRKLSISVNLFVLEPGSTYRRRFHGAVTAGIVL